jgi:hypothetical protein
VDHLDRLGLEHPVVQAGMGGGVAGGELAGAVSAAGGLGTVGIMAPGAFWCTATEAGPAWVRRVGRLSAPVGRRLPLSAMNGIVRRQRVGLGVFSPALPLRGMPAESVDRTALYAGETIHRLHDVIPAAEAVRRLTPP